MNHYSCLGGNIEEVKEEIRGESIKNSRVKPIGISREIPIEISSENSREILWEASSLHNGYKYGLSKAQRFEIDDVCEIVNAEEILEVWHLFRMSIHDVLEKSLEYNRVDSSIDSMFNKPASGRVASPIDSSIAPSVSTLDSLFTDKGIIYSLYRKNEYEKNIIGMGGITPLPNIGNMTAEIWFIGSDMKEHSRFLARHAKEILRMAFEKYPILINVVGTWNKRSIRWLQYLGFFVEKTPQYMGMNKALFHRFYMTKQMFDKKYNFNTKAKKEKICVHQAP